MSGWSDASTDFGQKIDLTVRIREILRNYPEGLSILKELLQNADDAGARTVRFVVAEPRGGGGGGGGDDALSAATRGPSLLAYNDAGESGELCERRRKRERGRAAFTRSLQRLQCCIASSSKPRLLTLPPNPYPYLPPITFTLPFKVFTETDFKSIQQIGNSLKKAGTGNKTGRFGVGVNSVYHLTEVPMFTSQGKVVLFDPQVRATSDANSTIQISTDKARQPTNQPTNQPPPPPTCSPSGLLRA